MGFYQDPTSTVKSSRIGEGTKIWQYCVVFAGAVIGKDCNICANSLVEDDVVIGDRVTVKSGVYIWNGVRIGDGVFIGPCVAFTNDKYPRSKAHLKKHPEILLMEGASIGANSTLIAGITVGRYSLIGAGSVLTKDVPDHTIWFGNPARQKGYVCRCGGKIGKKLVCGECSGKYAKKGKGLEPLG